MGDLRADARRAIVRDTDGRIAADVPCGQCGYNLRTIEANAVCPECAQPATGAIDKYLARLCFAPPEWVKGLVTGGVLLIVGLPFAAVISMTVSLVLQFVVVLPAMRSGTFGPATLGSMRWYGLVISIVTLGALTPVLLGIRKLTAPEPGGAAGPERARRTARTALGVGLLLYLLALAVSLVNRNPVMPPFATTATLDVVLTIVSTILGAAFQLAAGVCAVALLLHLTALLRRFERQRLAAFGRVLLVGVGLATLLLVVAVVGGAVVALTMPTSVYSTWPTTLPVTTPATTPAVTAIPAPPARLVGNLGLVSGCAGCVFFVTAIAGYIFVIMGTLAFSGAREAAAATAALLAVETQKAAPPTGA